MKNIGNQLRSEYKKKQLSEIMKKLNIEEVKSKPQKSFFVLSISFVCTSFILLILSISILIYTNSKVAIPQYSEIEIFLKENTDEYFVNPISVIVIEDNDSYSFLNIYYGISNNRSIYFFEYKSNSEENTQIGIKVVDDSIGNASSPNNQLVLNIKLNTASIEKYEGTSTQLNISIKNQSVILDVENYFKYLIEKNE